MKIDSIGVFNGQLLKEMNHTHIVLIPKNDLPSTVINSDLKAFPMSITKFFQKLWITS